MNDAKDDFEKEHDKILGQLPQSIRGSFGILGFCPSGHGSCNSDDDDDKHKDHPTTLYKTTTTTMTTILSRY
jgi:hypothetical protein